MIVIEPGARLERKMGLRVIVSVEGDDLRRKMRRKLAGERCFPGAGEACDTDEKRFQTLYCRIVSGGMGEWLKPAVLKTDLPLPCRSHKSKEIPLPASD